MSARGLTQALHYFQVEDYGAAVKQYSLLMNELPLSEHFVIYSNQGLAYLKMAKFNQAIQCFTIATEKFPYKYELFHNLGVAFMCVGDEEKAMSNISMCLNKNPNFLPALCCKCLLLCNLGRTEEALSVLEYVKDDHKKESDIFKLAQGFLNLKKENFEQGSKIFSSYSSQTDATRTLNALCLFGLAKSLYGERKFDLSLEYLQKSIRVAPSARKYFARACVLLKAGSSLNEISKCLQSAVLLEPTHLPSLELLGLLAAKQGNFGEAVKQLRKCVDINPKDIRARYNLGLALLKQRDYKESQRQFNILLEIKTDHELAKRACQVIELHLAAHPSAALKLDILPESSSFKEPLSDLPDVDMKSLYTGFSQILTDNRSFSSLNLSETMLRDNYSILESNPDKGFSKAVEEEKVEVEVHLYPIEVLREAVKGNTVKDLVGVLSIRLEESLDDDDFNKAFGMNRIKFHSLLSGEQASLRKLAGLAL